MKILIAGEASVHVSNYCRAIRPFVDEIILLTETPLEVPEASHRHLVGFRSGNPVRWLQGAGRLKEILAEEKPDLIHLHQVNRLAFFVCRAAVAGNYPVVTTAWGSDVLLVPERNFIYSYFTSYVIRHSRFVTADAKIMIDAMKPMDDTESKYVLLQYGIDPVTPARKENLIYSNRLHRPLYNIDVIIRDFAEFSKKHPDWKLVIGGSGPETGNLETLARELGIQQHSEFTGWQNKNENDSNYAKAAIYVSIPSSDGTSVSLLEALSADCIPVVSDLPVTKEWIANGINGVVRKAGKNPFDEALMLDREKCLRINREKINASVDRKETTKKFFSIYQKALASK